ncbi:MAG: FtsX-like permease family protein [Kiritimatiellae bacterium]|jgi:hypothetical protein|nr:FtsX-like permease family protein [Kiritimatiellia bacterium]
MKTDKKEKIVIENQVRLSTKRTLQISINGIYYRLFRSLVTVAIVAVAVAFMMYMLANSLIGRAVYVESHSNAIEYKVYERWLDWIGPDIDDIDIFRTLGSSSIDDYRVQAIAKWGKIDEDTLKKIMLSAQRSEPYFVYYDELSPGKKYLMAGGIPTGEFFVYMADKKNAAIFKERLEKSGGLTFPGSFDELVQLSNFYISQADIWNNVSSGRTEAINALKAAYSAKSFSEYLADPTDALTGDFIKFGFADSNVDLPLIYSRAKTAKDVRRLNDLLRQSNFRRELSQEMGISNLSLDMDAFAKFYGSKKNQEKFQALVKRTGVNFSMDPDRIEEILKDSQLKQRVMEVEQKTLAYSRGKFGFSIGVIWLIGVSFIVCIVGITNAMLMSVMERFREIATMKCLGATDSLVMSMFVFESCIQGVVGGFLGAILALLLSISVAMIQYGASVLPVLPYDDLGISTLIAMGIGVVLAALASVYPAYVASRLAPMEAMRLE